MLAGELLSDVGVSGHLSLARSRVPILGSRHGVGHVASDAVRSGYFVRIVLVGLHILRHFNMARIGIPVSFAWLYDARHLPYRLAVRAFDGIGEVAVKMAMRAALAMEVHANVSALPLHKGVRV